jgi:hypothetical protein
MYEPFKRVKAVNITFKPASITVKLLNHLNWTFNIRFVVIKLWLWTGDSHIWSKRPPELKLGDRLAVYMLETITKFQLHY